MDQNSYDSGDWFNKIDWSGQTANWASACRSPARTAASGRSCRRCSLTRPLRRNPPTSPQRRGFPGAPADSLQLRALPHVGPRRHPAEPDLPKHRAEPDAGLIVMKLDDNAGHYDLQSYRCVQCDERINFTDGRLQGLKLKLHPVQKSSSGLPGHPPIHLRLQSREQSPPRPHHRRVCV